MDLNYIIILFTAASFIIYGISAFTSKRMAKEYKRWGFNKSRKTIGVFQLLGGIGLLIGLLSKLILLSSSIGLAFMMFIAILVRIKIKDPVVEMLPAFTYLLLTSFIISNYL